MMMHNFFKLATLCYLVLGLSLAPLSAHAISNKNSKASTATSAKQKELTKHAANVKTKKTASTRKSSAVNTKRAPAGFKLVNHTPTKINAKTRKSVTADQAISAMNATGYDGSSPLMLSSSKALVIHQETNEVIFAKNTDLPTPIASVTKLMTAMVLLDANVDMDAVVKISVEDVDYLKGTSSRLALGTELTRKDLVNLALIASENRAASAIASSFPGGRANFIHQMNQKALALGMTNTYFTDSTGLSSRNVSTAEDLAKMVNAAYEYPLIRDSSTTASYEVYLPNKGYTTFNNTNGLVRKSDWDIGLSKTGYISEAGRCLVMQAKLAGQPVIIVLLDSDGKFTRIGDANRVRKWVEYNAGAETLPIKPNMAARNITVGQITTPDLSYTTKLSY